MARLSPTELRSRLALDYRVLRGLRAPSLGRVSAFASIQALRARREVSEAEGLAGEARLYVVRYTFRFLTSPSTTADVVDVAFSIPDGADYPFSSPHATVLSTPRAWSPHVHPGSGIVCLGDGWPRARGRMLLAQLVVHVARLMNFDEPDQGSGYDGFNHDAITHWRRVLHGRPYDPALMYPVLPTEITHGVTESTGFRPAPPRTPLVVEAPVFRARVIELGPPTPAFRPTRRAS